MYYLKLKEAIISKLIGYSKVDPPVLHTEDIILLIEGDTGASPKLIRRMIEILVIKGYLVEADNQLRFVPKKEGVYDGHKFEN